MCRRMVDIRGEAWQLYVVVFMVRSESEYAQRLLASLICSKRDKFEYGSAVSLAASSSKS